jgi:hypothetical protein
MVFASHPLHAATRDLAVIMLADAARINRKMRGS